MFDIFNRSVEDPKNSPQDPGASTPTGDTDPQPELSPLEKIQQLLYPESESGKTGDEGDTTPPEPVDPTKIFENEEAVTKLLSSVDFTKNISPKTQSLLEEGKPEGFAQMTNDIGKAAFLEALKISTALNQKTVEDAVQRTLEKSKGQISESLGDYELRKEMPQLDNPVIRLGLDALKDRLKAQNPTMSPSELATQLKGFLKGANELVNPGPKQKADETNEPAQSWEDWLSN